MGKLKNQNTKCLSFPLSAPLSKTILHLFPHISASTWKTVTFIENWPTNDSHPPESASHCFVVHVGFVLVGAPQSRHGLGVDEFEDSLRSVGPLDEAGTVLVILQQLQQELPKVGRRTCLTKTNVKYPA